MADPKAERAAAEPDERGGRLFVVHFDYGGFAFCGTKGHYRLTTDDLKVTCHRCQNKLGGQEDRQ